ncbi:MAG: hypothetical protein H6835_08385 [Planctomycetes bacterium]|nr:hypothetical protein [Planctomycetota bacterium]
MSPRILLRLLAVLFATIGWLLTRAATSDPAPRDGWQTFRGALASTEFVDTQKLGRRAVVTLDAPNDGQTDERRFARDHLERLPQLEPALRALPPRAPLEVMAVPRSKAGWAAPEGQPLTMLVLRHGDEVLYDRDRDEPGGDGLALATTIAGGAAIALGVALLLVSLRRRGPA